jgi:hypothetical protein
MRAPTGAPAVCRFAFRLALALLGAAWATIVTAAPEKVAGGIRFTYHDAGAKSVAWAGAFNGWSMTANPMTAGSDGTWSIVVALPPGEQQYKFVADGQWLADPENPVTGGDFGNSVVKVAADGSLVTQTATSNSPYNPKILMGGRVIGLYQEDYDGNTGRWELTRPTFDMDLDMAIRISDVMQAHALLNINPMQEDVQAYRARLNLKRGSLVLTQPGFVVTAFDSDTLGTWDDPLGFVGNLGVYRHPYGPSRQGLKLEGERAGFRGTFLYADNFDDRLVTNSPLYNGFSIDNFPPYILGPSNSPAYVFEGDPIGRSILLLRTVRTATGFALVPGQASKVATMDMGDNGRLFGYGNNNMNTGALRIGRTLRSGLEASVLARTDRGFNLGRMVFTTTTGDSTLRNLNTLYVQEWFGGGGEARWAISPNARAWGELLVGARRMSFVNGSVQNDYVATRITADSTYARLVSSGVPIDGTHLTTDHGWRGTLGGEWTLAQGDIGLRASVTSETHAQPYWSQSPVTPAGLTPDDHARYLTVDFQRADYLSALDELDNRTTTWRFGWDRNWRYYLGREVKSRLDVEWTNFSYDHRTSWEHQVWFPTGNFWLESGQHLVGVDRLTLLGQPQVVSLRPGLEVPIARRRDVRFAWSGVYTGVRPDHQPRYAESRFQLGFQLARTVRWGTDLRWVKYNAPDLALEHGYLSAYNGVVLAPASPVEIRIGIGVDPRVLDPVTNDYADHGRESYLENLNANGFIAETNYTSLAPQIAAAEKSLAKLRRIQLQAVVRF